MAKDPARWDEVIVDAPNATLTKQQVHDYYANPKVQNHLLDAVKGRATIIRQSFDPNRVVLRRKDPKGNLIRMNAQRLADLNQVRMSEVHQTFGPRVSALVADIDPQENVPWRQTKTIAETVARTMETHPDVKSVDVRFSGGRGFYVQGNLASPMDVNAARKKTKQILHGIAQRDDVTFGVADKDQVRLDMSPLKNKGSIRAPFSLNVETGLVSMPVKLKDLPSAKRTDFTMAKAVKQAAETLYHGSPEKLDVLEPRDLHGDPRIPKAVFGAPSRDFAMTYSGGKWGDRDLEQSTKWKKGLQKIVMQEMRPGAIQDVYDQPGYLYDLPGEGFKAPPRRGATWEQINENAVTPSKIEEIKNVLNALETNPNVELLPYSEAAARKRLTSKRRSARLAEMTPDERAGYLEWYAERMPKELAPDLEALRQKVGSAKGEKLYHYAPKDAPILEDGLRAPRALSGEALEGIMSRWRRQRADLLAKLPEDASPEDIMDRADAELDGLSTSISSLRSPIGEGSPQAQQEYARGNQLYEIDYDKLRRAGLVSKADIVEEQPRSHREVSPENLVRELPTEMPEGVGDPYLFSGHPHAKLTTEGYTIPPEFITKVKEAADHAAQRLKERAPDLNPSILKALRKKVKGMKLPPGAAHHVPLHNKADMVRAYAVLKGKRPSVATVLHRGMAPPGSRLERIKESAQAQHTIVTGAPGSGKTTYVNELQKQTGLPVYSMDDDPVRKDALQKMYDATDEWRKGPTAQQAERTKREMYAARDRLKEVQTAAMLGALGREEPHIIDGYQALDLERKDLEPHRRILVDPGEARTLEQYVSRELGKGLESEEHLRREAASMRNSFRPALKDFREIPGTEVLQSKKVEQIKAAAEEFAPGIPAEREIADIPDIQDAAWRLATQQHNAQRAGPHYDVRLVDPATQQAHSWAVPKGRYPTVEDRMLRAIQQPTHTEEYARNFSGNIPEGYGAGDVELLHDVPTQVRAAADKIHFQGPEGEPLVLFRTNENQWGFKRLNPQQK